MLTRGEEFQEVRRLLGFPKFQKPSPDEIFSGLFAAEQYIRNAMTNSRREWTLNRATITTVADQAEYQVVPADVNGRPGMPPGKPWNIYHVLENGQILPIPWTDVVNEMSNQHYEFVVLPPTINVNPGYYNLSAQKAAFFRQDSQLWVRLFPIPDTADTEYVIQYITGRSDYGLYDWNDRPESFEYTTLKTVMAAMRVVGNSEWEGHSLEQTLRRRSDLRADLANQFTLFREQFESHIGNLQNEPVSDTGYWWEI